MSASIVDATDGILTIKFTGKLTQPELAAVQKSADEFVQQHGKVRFLAVAENFQGWEKGGDWGDLSLQAEVDPHIEKMAIVGEKKWEELALVFTAQGFRGFPIEYFQPAELKEARAWLARKD
ncbi:MAG TPA: STAS/SEC14 domain-containing protein [Candidatus Binatia bacterium]|nr:STAS/SEC14 domain-containing protein [Candidatus Binatia bacterium]